MKKFRFKPLPGLTLITLIMLSILIGLGTWQYQRLGWKTALLAEIDTAANSAPLSSLNDVTAALEADEPLDFRRIGVRAKAIPFEEPLRVYTARDNDYGWRLFVPISDDEHIAYAALNVVNNGEEASAIVFESKVLAGYIRVARDGKVRTRSTPEQNRWFGFNPMPETHNWADRMPGLDVRYYLDVVVGETGANSLPVKTPEIRNNHFEYMLTWYSLALILLIYYLLIHRREGRLGWS